MKPHKHAEVLRAIADGKEVEYLWGATDWVSRTAGINPINYPNYEWRIKPEPKPDVGYYIRTYEHSNIHFLPHFLEPTNVHLANLFLIFDGETGKLKYSKVL